MTQLPEDEFQQPPAREPAFNVPGVIVVLAASMLAIHALREWVFSQQFDLQVLLYGAFFPGAFGAAAQGPVPWWTPFSYSLLHGGWVHLLMNLFWLVAFGTPLARRIGTGRTLLAAILASAGGALAHFLVYAEADVPMIGASAVVSGFMGAASRFAFGGISPRAAFRHDRPAMTLVESFANPRFLTFFAVWMGVNFIFGAASIAIPGQDGGIAWQAHIGGFLVGLLAFPLLDRKQPI